jgi:hypothetical protein
MKIGVIFFHKGIRNIYKENWIKKSVKSIIDQTYSDINFYEINYGGDEFTLKEYFQEESRPWVFVNEIKENHADAMNFILDKSFNDGCNFVFNTNLDDYYSTNRIEKQLEYLTQGYDIVSSDFCYIQENLENEDIVTFHKNINQFGSVSINLEVNHNVIAHPSVAYSRKFWSDGHRYNSNEIPREDLLLWKRSILNGIRFIIHPETLLFYRLHQNQITGNNYVPS